MQRLPRYDYGSISLILSWRQNVEVTFILNFCSESELEMSKGLVEITCALRHTVYKIHDKNSIKDYTMSAI